MELHKYRGVISALLTPSNNYREKSPDLIDFRMKLSVRGFLSSGRWVMGVKLERGNRCDVAEAVV